METNSMILYLKYIAVLFLFSSVNGHIHYYYPSQYPTSQTLLEL